MSWGLSRALTLDRVFRSLSLGLGEGRVSQETYPSYNPSWLKLVWMRVNSQQRGGFQVIECKPCTNTVVHDAELTFLEGECCMCILT